MKNYKLLTLFVTLLLISSCSGLTEKVVKFENWNINIELPKKFKSYNYNELAKLVESEDEPDRNIVIGNYLMQFMYNSEIQVLIDSTSFYNCVAIAGFDGSIYLRPEFIKPAGNLTTLKLNQMYKQVGGDVEPIEGSLKDGKHYRYMKLKYKLSVNDKDFFYANYLIRLKDRMISIAVINDEDEDFENSISKVAVYNVKKNK
jgi:hypothetical protein